jgi:excreted virulence factor EspC (type VII ESX diderm)
VTDTSVQPEGIRDAATGLHDTAASFEAQIQAFVDTVNGLVEEPGTDMVSPLIWAAHDAVFTIAMQCLTSNTAVLHSHADRLHAAADRFDAVDRVNADHFDRLHRAL